MYDSTRSGQLQQLKWFAAILRHSLPVFWRHYGSRLGTTRRCSPRLIVDNELYQSLCNLNCTRMRNEVYSAVSCKVDWFFTTGSPSTPPPRHIHTDTFLTHILAFECFKQIAQLLMSILWRSYKCIFSIILRISKSLIRVTFLKNNVHLYMKIVLQHRNVTVKLNTVIYMLITNSNIKPLIKTIDYI